MAATGGGKIRSRRYHIASKPYAKSKQQPGLISRVTDTVKSIVPSWLQKYFKNSDVAEGGGAPPAVEQNSKAPPPNGSEEGPPPLDGRDSPEPSTSNTEPSTSRASLNFQDYVLSRPPLNRSHLHFPPLDPSSPALGGPSSLFSQPSTSSAPGPFSTGFSLVKEIKENLSQHEDDNISTTSGFSSRASDKDVPTSKTASLPQLWSPETDRTHSGPQTTQSGLKKPAFNLSVFGSSSNSLNSTVLSSSQLGDSPFYPGKTTYGGAAARSPRTRPRPRPSTPYQPPVRRQIKAKPAGAQPCGVTSATARRILQSLERMSSPLADAKRIPSAASSPMSASLDGTNLDLSHFQRKRKWMDSHLPPVQKLVIPAAVSVSGNRSVSFRPSLTPGGLGRTLDRTPKDTPTRQSPQIPEAVPGPSQSTTISSGPTYPLSSTPAVSNAGSGGGKMKRERTTTRPSSKRPEDEEVAEIPDLPAISLPISTFSLPVFSFASPPPTTSINANPAPAATLVTPAKEPLADDKEPPPASTPPCVPFTFSSPIVKATAASPPSFSPSAGFTFSAPVAKMDPSISNDKLITPIVAAVKSTTSNSTEEFEGPFKPAKTLKQGSVLDLLKTPGFASPVARSSPQSNTPSLQTTTESAASAATTTTTSSSSTGFGDLFKAPAGSWDCDVCMVQNKPSDTKCVACMSLQPNSSSKPSDSKPAPATPAGLENNTDATSATTTTTTGFGAIFATPAGTWECDTCLVQNKPEAVKCVACETAKPGTGVKPSLTLPSAFSAAKTESAPTAPASTGFAGFGDQFKKATGAWECDTCMVENAAQDTKCVACMSAKPGAAAAVAPSSAPAPTLASSAPLSGFGDKFKKPEGDWDCDVCCVQNKAADVQCVACQSAKPGAKVEPKAFGASAFGSSAFGAPDSGAGGFKFGSSSDSTSGSGGFKFGGTLSDSTSSTSSGGFKFGGSFGSSSSETTSKDTSGSSGFKLAGTSEGFKFGAPAPTPAMDDKKSEPTVVGSGFKFGASDGIAFGNGASSTESKPATGGFSFGLSKPEEETTTTTTTPSSSSTFSLPSASQDQSDGGASSAETTSTSTTTTAASAGSVFGRLGDTTLTTTAPLGGSTFGSSTSAEKEPAAPMFSFMKPEEKKEAASAFLFNAASKEAEATLAPVAVGGFSFSKSDPPKEQAPPAYTFGKAADKSEAPEAPKPSFSFGQSATDTAASKPAFTFMANTTTTTSSSSSSTTPAPSLFGTASSTAQAPAPAATPFLFGQATSSSSDAPPAKTFLFGQSQDSQPAAPAAPSMNSTPTPAPAQPFLFGAAAANAAPPAAPSFGFGAAVPPAASSAAPSAGPAPFVFSSPSSGGFGANQTPSFGSAFGSPTPSPFSAATSQPPAFGAKPNATPIFGQQANSTPVFGAVANSTPGGGFQFGGASAFGASSTNTGVFAFGGGAAATPAPSATPSIAPQPAAPGGGFNFAQPPAFNIGSVKSSFTASPAGPPTIAGRKIKTAVRRRK